MEGKKQKERRAPVQVLAVFNRYQAAEGREGRRFHRSGCRDQKIKKKEAPGGVRERPAAQNMSRKKAKEEPRILDDQ